MNTRHKLSALVITFNEENNIHRCLSSLLPVADEIIVVDSFSTDNTEAICSEFGVRFIKHPFVGHIEQKNYAVDQATYNLVLSLDADEALSEELQANILVIKNLEIPLDGYRMNRLTNYCGKWIWHSGWYPDAKLRLWDRQKGYWGGVNPHDRVVLQSIEIGHLKGNLLHFSYHSISQHVKQINLFTDIAAKSKLSNGKISNFYIIKILIAPPWEFIKKYIIKLGFMDGYYGFIIAILGSYYKFLKYIKIKQLYSWRK